MYLAPQVAGVVARQLRAPGGRRPACRRLALTPRERDVLGLVAEGHSNREIGEALDITERTARTHVSNILAKLDLTSRTQAALYAVEQGLDGDAPRAPRHRS